MRCKPKKVEKEWGYELWLANNEKNNYCGKILHIEKGHRSSLHYHVDKHETFYILNGILKVTTIDTEMGIVAAVDTLKQGETMEIDRYVPHLLEAAETVDIIEISTFHRDLDSYRINK